MARVWANHRPRALYPLYHGVCFAARLLRNSAIWHHTSNLGWMLQILLEPRLVRQLSRHTVPRADTLVVAVSQRRGRRVWCSHINNAVSCHVQGATAGACLLSPLVRERRSRSFCCSPARPGACTPAHCPSCHCHQLMHVHTCICGPLFLARLDPSSPRLLNLSLHSSALTSPPCLAIRHGITSHSISNTRSWRQ
jgi:hypothetical protein